MSRMPHRLRVTALVCLSCMFAFASPGSGAADLPWTGKLTASSTANDPAALLAQAKETTGGAAWDALRSPWARTVASAHSPPTKPSSSPSESTRAESPGLALVGRSARTTVAHTNGVPAALSAAARVARSLRLGTAVSP